MTDSRNTRLLVVDDEDSIREVLTDFLTMEGYLVTAVSNGERAIEALQAESYDAILLDMKMPGMNGLELLDKVGEMAPHACAIMMTGYGTVETAIAAMKKGAYDYILKPFKVQEVIRLVERGLEKKRLEAENIQLRDSLRLYELSEQISTLLELGKIYDVLIDTARDEVDADGVALWTRQKTWDCDRSWMRSALETRHADIMDAVDLSMLEEHAGLSESMIFHGEDARDLVSRDAVGLFSVLAVPLRTKNEIIGFFVAFAFGKKGTFLEGKRKMLSVLCDRASAAIENARLYVDLKGQFKQTIQAFANLLEDKDPYTRGHSERVSKYAVMIAEGMGMDDDEVQKVADGALMHDIGKLGIRYEDLNKSEPLTQAEYEMFKSHTTRGRWILEPIEFLHDLIPAVYHHHERWDGKGYPVGLAGEEIPLHARILAIADTYDAMTSHRAYRRALPHDVAVQEIETFSGQQFDPDLVEVFVREIATDRRSAGAKAARWNTLKRSLSKDVAGSAE